MKTNEEYWKQRCLLAESMLEERIERELPSTVIMTSFQKTYTEFMDLLNSVGFIHFYSYDKTDRHFINILDTKGEVVFNCGSTDRESAYKMALRTLKTYLNKEHYDTTP